MCSLITENKVRLSRTDGKMFISYQLCRFVYFFLLNLIDDFVCLFCYDEVLCDCLG